MVKEKIFREIEFYVDYVEYLNREIMDRLSKIQKDVDKAMSGKMSGYEWIFDGASKLKVLCEEKIVVAEKIQLLRSLVEDEE